MENSQSLERLTKQAKIERQIAERTPQALLVLLRALREGNMKNADAFFRLGFDPNTIIVLGDEHTPEGMRVLAKTEGWDIHDEITLLGICSFVNDEKSVLWLLKHGVHVTTPFDNGRDALWLAMSKGHERLMSLLKDEGASVRWSLPKEDNVNRLIFATRLSNPQMVLWLKRNKQDMFSKDAKGRTALHYNFMQNPYQESDQRIAEILLEEGLNPDTKDDFGMPAHGYGNEEVKNFLLSKGYDHLAEVSFAAQMDADAYKEKKENDVRQKMAKKTVPNQRISIAKPMRGPKIMGH